MTAPQPDLVARALSWPLEFREFLATVDGPGWALREGMEPRLEPCFGDDRRGPVRLVTGCAWLPVDAVAIVRAVAAMIWEGKMEGVRYGLRIATEDPASREAYVVTEDGWRLRVRSWGSTDMDAALNLARMAVQ